MKKRKFAIGNRIVSDDCAPLVIAEIGINHNGSLSTAIEIVDAAYNAGAEIIKHQTHIVDDEMSQEAKNIIPINAKESIYDLMKRCSLSEEEELNLKSYVESKGMIYISTPFSRAAANRLEKMKVPAYKIGSGEMNNHPLIDHIAALRKPMIVSTGMNSLKQVKECVSIIQKYKTDFALLHTTNLYPTPPELVRLGGMLELMEEFPEIVIGLSDHTTNNNACLAATALGALILERHFIDTKERYGPDIICSMIPSELEELIRSSSEISKMRGGEKLAAKEESKTMEFAFATVVAIKDIKRGDELTNKNIWVKRPGIGEIKAEYYSSIIGKHAKKNIYCGHHLKWLDLEEK